MIKFAKNLKSCLALAILFQLAYFSNTSVVKAEGLVPVPQIEVSSTVYNFGKVKEGSVVEHKFKIENNGAADLKIEKVHSSCGCTAAVLDSEVIKPSDKTDLKVTFDTAGFQGNKIKTVRIYTNDPKQSSVIFSLQGKVESDFELSLSKVSFGEVFKGQVKELRFKVNSNSGYKILEANTRSQYLDVTLNPTNNSLVNVKLRDSIPIGLFHERIALKTDSPQNPVINVPVEAKIIGDLQLEPDTISFGLVDKQGSFVEEKLLVKNNSKKKISITALKADTDKVSAQITKKGNDGSFEITVRLSTTINGTVKNVLQVLTDNSDQQQQILEIPIYGIINKKN
ncbi:MAG: DUF1573 domain-containing protein [Proteobacteria bacterium]|nr:DUF1573 domain-containing protein [Pseudomonadota bacterium]